LLDFHPTSSPETLRVSVPQRSRSNFAPTEISISSTILPQQTVREKATASVMVKKHTEPITIRKWSFEVNYKKNLEKSIHLKTSGTDDGLR
jgi:hypothetical protein